MKVIKGILFTLLFFFAITFCLQNTDEVTLRYYGWVKDLTTHLFLVVLASVFLGVIIGLVGSSWTTMKLRIKLNRQTKEAEDLRKELESLKGEKKSKPKSPSSHTTQE